MIGNADGTETVTVVDPRSGGIHLHLHQYLRMNQIFILIGSPVKPGTLLDEPVQVVLGILIVDQSHFRDEVRLIQQFNGHADGS